MSYGIDGIYHQLCLRLMAPNFTTTHGGHIGERGHLGIRGHIGERGYIGERGHIGIRGHIGERVYR